MDRIQAIEIALQSLYYHDKPDFTHDDFTFKKGDYYQLYHESDGICIEDDNYETHDLTWEEAKQYLSPVGGSK